MASAADDTNGTSSRIGVIAATRKRASLVVRACDSLGLRAVAARTPRELVADRDTITTMAVDRVVLGSDPLMLRQVLEFDATVLLFGSESSDLIASRLAGICAAVTHPGWYDDTFLLGALRVDRRAAAAWLQGVPLSLSPLLFAGLLALSEAWNRTNPAPMKLDYDDIRRIKAALGGHADLIVTVHGRGYRFVRDVREARHRSGQHRIA